MQTIDPLGFFVLRKRYGKARETYFHYGFFLLTIALCLEVLFYRVVFGPVKQENIWINHRSALIYDWMWPASQTAVFGLRDSRFETGMFKRRNRLGKNYT